MDYPAQVKLISSEPLAGSEAARRRLWKPPTSGKKSSRSRESFPFAVPVLASRRSPAKVIGWIPCRLFVEAARHNYAVLGTAYKYRASGVVLDRESFGPAGVLRTVISREYWSHAKNALRRGSAAATREYRSIVRTGIPYSTLRKAIGTQLQIANVSLEIWGTASESGGSSGVRFEDRSPIALRVTREEFGALWDVHPETRKSISRILREALVRYISPSGAG